MRDNLERIGNQVLKQVTGEMSSKPEQYAIMCVEANFDGRDMVFWLYNKPLRKQSKDIRNFAGNLVTTAVGSEQMQRFSQGRNHESLCKNELLGGQFIINGLKRFKYSPPKGPVNVDVESMTDYSPSFKSNISDAIDGKISLKGEAEVRFNSLRNKLIELNKNQELIELQEKLNTQVEIDEATKLRKRINDLESEILTELAHQQRYVRDSILLRMQPILDAEQETVKRSKILNGHLIIDGGPGTGKTTTLIQRINFLTSNTISEYRNDLSNDDVEELEGNWRFFSPSRLLRVYLRNSMTEEGLSPSDSNTKVWQDYLDEVFKYYRLFNPTTLNPFVKARKLSNPIFPNDYRILNTIFNELEYGLLEDLKKQLQNVLDLNTENLFWSDDATNLKYEIRNALKINTLPEYVILFEKWKAKYKKQYDLKFSTLRSDIEIISSRAQVVVQNKYPEIISDILEEIRIKFDGKKEVEIENEFDLDGTDFDLSDIQSFNEEIELTKFFRNFTTAYAISKLKNFGKKTDVLRLWESKLSIAYKNLDLTKISQQIYYRQFVSLFTNGSGKLVFNRFPVVYKRNREKLVQVLNESGYHSSEFDELVKNDRKRIHYDEMNLIMWFINSIIRESWFKSKNTVSTIGHNFSDAWLEEQKSVLAIDEATDFSLIELAAMSSFSNPKYSSVTLSGDLMQRMTKNGIQDWNNLSEFFPEIEIGSLNVSYRQSPTLLKIASHLYRNVTNTDPSFRSYLSESKGEPSPLVVKIVGLPELIIWLEEQIYHVYKLYNGNIPSIAIFAENDDAVDHITRLLNESDRLNDIGISVRGCRSDSEIISDTQVCVYNVKTIKGLEFEAVFFINVDKIEMSDENMLQKYLYVGLSRASFYLGISYVNELPEQIKFLSEWEVEDLDK